LPRGDPPDEWLFAVGEAMTQGASGGFDTIDSEMASQETVGGE
jgi:hypothetical protein